MSYFYNRQLIARANQAGVTFQTQTPTWLTVTFSDGNFKALGKPTKPNVVTTEESPAEETRDQQEAPPKPIYTCPQDGCTSKFQLHAASERHLFYNNCQNSRALIG